MQEHKNNVLLSLIVVLMMLFLIHCTHSYNVFSLAYGSSADIGFTFNPSVAVGVSGDLVISNMSPGNVADSNEITITASTNYEDGLILAGTVGNSTDTNPSHNSTNLTHSNGTNVFASLLPTDSYSGLNDSAITTNTWGYATKATTGDNQVWSSYSGLPIYNDAGGGTVLMTSTTFGTNTMLFKIGAKSLPNQVAGTYTNTINFTATIRIVTTDYSISYNDTTSEATNLPSSQTGTITTPTRVNLSQTTPARSGYDFAGWCSVNNSSDPSTCTGTTYQPGDHITISNPGGNLTVPLYAVWESAGYEVTISLINPQYSQYFQSAIVYDQKVDYRIPSGNVIGSFDGPEGSITVTTRTGSLGILFTSSREVLSPGPTFTDGIIMTYNRSDGIYSFSIQQNGSITFNGTAWDD